MEEGDIEKFIESVQKRDILWNLCHPQYKNIKKKAQEWQNIANEFGLPIDVVKRKWKSLRDSYSRNLSKKKSSEQTTDEPEYVWKYGDILEFLKEHMKPRMTTSDYSSLSLKDTATPSPSVTSRDEVDHEGACSALSKTPESPCLMESPFVMESTFVTESPFPKLSECSSISSRASKKREASTLEETFVSTMHSVQEFLKKPRATTAFSSSSATDLEDELFCRSLLEKLKTFPLHLRNEAKIGMMKYVSDIQVEYELKKVNKD